MLRRLFGSILLAGLAATSVAASDLSCELRASSCSDSAPRAVYVPTLGRTVMVPPPTQDGVGACWLVSRTYQCVEKNPTFACASGADYATVKDKCSLTGAVIKDAITLNAVQYITDAEYTYRCAYTPKVCETELPGSNDCRVLTEKITDLASTASLSGSSAPLTNSGSGWAATQLTDTLVTDQQLDTTYVCYQPPVTTCADTCQETFNDPATGKMGTRDVACTSPVTNCVEATGQCLTENGVPMIGPDGHCIKHLATSICQAGATPKCLADSNCTLESTTPSGVQANGVAFTEKQTYLCSNTKEECLEVATVSNCVSANAWGWDKDTSRNPAGKGLGDVNAAIAKVEGVQKGVNNEDFYLFSGLDRRCSYPVGSFLNAFIMIVVAIAVSVMFPAVGAMAQNFMVTTMGMTTTMATNVYYAYQAASTAMTLANDAKDTGVFGNDCCKSYIIKGTDKWYKSGSCSADEVKLAVARSKGLTHYIGEYCSKKGGFPVRECKKKTRTFCVFDDKLALTVNEQGRAQLEALVSADTDRSSASAAIPFDLYLPTPETVPEKYADYPTAKWVPLVSHNKSQIWYWQWPSYCKSSAEQALAFKQYQAEIDAASALDSNGPVSSEDPVAYTAAVSLATYRVSLIPPFQECSADPGFIMFMTCNRADDACDITKLPGNPGDVAVNNEGTAVDTSDPSWEIHPVDSRSAAALSGQPESVSEYVGALGSCSIDGHCLYSFNVLDKLSAGAVDPATGVAAKPQGAIRRISDSFGFPLYAMPSANTPSIDYLSVDGVITPGAWEADINAGRGDAFSMTYQQFIPRPLTISVMPAGATMHKYVLLEWYHSPKPNGTDRGPIRLVKLPTTLPEGTVGFWPYRDPADSSKLFYIKGGCDPNSRWCTYTVELETLVLRHPWGSPKNPRCWGFTLEQMAALDFNKMDLSQWIDSLNLSGMATGMEGDTAQALKDQATLTSNTFYQAYKAGDSLPTSDGQSSLWVNTNTLPLLTSDAEESSYTIRAIVPANWPQWYSSGVNDNPVSDVRVFWGDGYSEPMVQAGLDGRAWQATHDYGNLVAKTYTLKVVMNTAKSGVQTLSTDIKIAPNKENISTTSTESALEFNRQGTSGASGTVYTPAELPNGVVANEATMPMVSPGFAEEVKTQGDTVK